MKRRFHKKRVSGRKELRKLALLHGVGEPDKNFIVSGNVPQARLGDILCVFCESERVQIIGDLAHCHECGENFSGKKFLEELAIEAAVSKFVGEGLNQIKRSIDMNFGDSAPQKQSKRSGGGESATFSDFFKGENLPVKGTVTAKIIGFREEALEFSKFQVDFRIGNKDWTLGLRDETDGRLRGLIKALGGNTNKWVGKSFKMTRHSKLDRSGNPRIQILPN